MFTEDQNQETPDFQPGYVCDACGRDLEPTQWRDEYQEALHIHYHPGPDSAHIPHGSTVECVLCQHCTRKILGKYLRITQPEVVPVIGTAHQPDDEYAQQLQKIFGGEGDGDDQTKH